MSAAPRGTTSQPHMPPHSKSLLPTSERYTTPFPNRLLDEAMPRLKDTEWRLLCVIVRQTVGWKAGNGDNQQRKEWDWITHQQLQRRTGRASEAICKALDNLVRKGLVEVWNDQNQPLLTPQARRRHAGKLYFRLGTTALSTTALSTTALCRKSEKPLLPSISETEIRKAKITKAIDTKILPKGSEHTDASSVQTSFDINKFASGARRVATRRKEYSQTEHADNIGHSSAPNPDVKRFLCFYRDLFKQRTLYGEPPVIDWGKDGKTVKQLLRLYSYERLLRLLEIFFRSDNPWIRKTGYSLFAFKTSIGSLLVSETTPVSEKAVVSERTAQGSTAPTGCSADSPPVTIRSGQWTKASSLLSQHRKEVNKQPRTESRRN